MPEIETDLSNLFQCKYTHFNENYVREHELA